MLSKRITALILSALMVFALLGVTASAADPDVVVEGAKVTAELTEGATVEVPVSATKNAGFATGKIVVTWDAAALTLTTFKAGFAPDNGSPRVTDKNSPRYREINVSTPGTYPVSFGSDLESNYTDEDVLFTLVFEIAEGAQAGTYEIGLEPEAKNCKDEDLAPVVFSATAGSVKLEAKPVPATSVAVDETDVTVDEGKTVTVTAKALPDDTTDEIVWTAVDPSIATVENGVITGVKEGTTYVTVLAGSAKAVVNVTVTKPAHVHAVKEGSFVKEKAPTCTDKGEAAHYLCTGCDAWLDAEGNEITEKEIPALGHDFVAGEPVAPTCTDEGYTPYTCSRCGETENRDVTEALGHDGVIEQNDLDTHYVKCSRCDYEGTEAHIWETKVTKAATHTEYGVKTSTCTKCGQTKEDQIPKLEGHTYENWTDNGDGEKHTGTCACGDKLVEDHTWDNGTVTKEPTDDEPGEKTYTCTKCGATKTEEFTEEEEEAFFYGPDYLAISASLRRAQEQLRLKELKKKEDAEKAKAAAEAAKMPVAAPEWKNPFTDVKKSDVYYDAVKFVNEKGLFIGVSDTEFAPDTTMTRAMFVTILGRLAKVDVSAYKSTSFTDVATGLWYSEYVEWAAEMGIILGYGDGTFGPDDKITVEQAAVIIARYAALIGIDTASVNTLTAFADGASVSAWAADAAAWAVDNGIYVIEDGKLNPQKLASRAVVAMMLYNFAK